MGWKKKSYRRGDVRMEILEAWLREIGETQILKDPGSRVGWREEYAWDAIVRKTKSRGLAAVQKGKIGQEQKVQNWENCLEEVNMKSS